MLLLLMLTMSCILKFGNSLNLIHKNLYFKNTISNNNKLLHKFNSYSSFPLFASVEDTQEAIEKLEKERDNNNSSDDETSSDYSVDPMEINIFLERMLSSRSNEEDKKELLQKLNDMRGMEVLFNSYVDDILLEVENVNNNFWANLPYPVPLPSYRVKLAICLKVLNSILLAEDSESDLNEASSSRKRRAILIILNQLVSTKGGIRRLQRLSSRYNSKAVTMEEMLKRTPSDLETPTYSVIESFPTGWEIRQYRKFSVCTTVMDMSNSTGGGAFNSLAGYIFGKNAQGEKMAMTTPVITVNDLSRERMGDPRNAANGATRMSFVLPSRFWGEEDISDAPQPLEESNVILESSGGGLSDVESLAVLWFGGYATRTMVDARTEELKSLVQADPRWRVIPNRDPFLMQYNDPFQPPWKRRNEIAIPIIPTSRS